MRILPNKIKNQLSRIKREVSGMRLTEFNQAKFDSAVAWMRKSRAGVVFLNISSLEVLAVVSVLKKVKGLIRGKAYSGQQLKTDQEPLTLLPIVQAKPRVLMIVEATIPQCLHYRVKQKVEQLERNDCYVEWHDWSDIPALQQALYQFDLILFYRVPGYQPILDLMKQAKALRKTVLYDIDDLIFDREQLSHAFQQTTDQLNDKDLQGILDGADLYKAAIQMSHYGIASTPALQAELAKLVQLKHCFLLANGLDQMIESLNEAPKANTQDGKLRIFYGSGTKTHDADFATIAKPLAQVMQENAHVELVLAGHLSVPVALQGFSERIQRLPVMKFKTFLICLQHMDIAIAPLKSGTFADCKSEIKWLEAACFAVPTVVAKTSRYQEVINEGATDKERTGFIAETEQEWLTALSTLVNDSDLRERVGTAAQQAAKTNYGSEAMAKQMQTLLADIQARAIDDQLMRVSTAKKRVMIANVLYPPQAIGGATTVVTNSIEGLLKKYPNDIEIEVLSTEMSDDRPYTLRQYEHQGVKVTVIRTPMHAQLESREFDERILELSKGIFSQSRPDLIHFHSMQRLTASPLQAAYDLQIPYYVTVHDAWWLSEHQFLLDTQDELVNYQQANPIVAAKTATDTEQTILRTHYLAKQLRGAKRIFAVSDFQSELYRNNGFKHIETLKNGVSEPAISASTIPAINAAEKKTNTEKLVLGYMGGISAHKGYDFLREIVMNRQFDNLQFTVVDLFKPSTFKESSHWGESAVITIGKQSSQHIDQFYKNIDVLIAPSIWPESFGLVSREAALHGVWVVAAKAGGMAEDVIDGETGFAFPMRDEEQCAAILDKLNQQWMHYKNNLPDVAQSRERIFSQTQHVELLAEYYLA